MYFENTNYAISRLLHDSKLAITQLRESSCSTPSTTQPQVPAGNSQVTQLVPTHKENWGVKQLNLVPRVNGAASLWVTSAGTQRRQLLQSGWQV